MKFSEVEERYFKLKTELEMTDRKSWLKHGENFFAHYQGKEPPGIDQRKFLNMNRSRLSPEDSTSLFEIEKSVDHAVREIDRIFSKMRPKGKDAERLTIEAIAHVLRAVESLKLKELNSLYSKVMELERKTGTTLEKMYNLEVAKLEAESLDETGFQQKIIDIRSGKRYSPEIALALKAKAKDSKIRKSLEEAFQQVPHFLSGAEGFRILQRIRELTSLDRGEYLVKILENGQVIQEKLSPASWLLFGEIKKEPEVIFK